LLHSLGVTVDQRTPSAQTSPLKATDHERVVVHRSGMVKNLVQLGIVLVGAAAETRPDLVVTALVELPPGALEVEQVALAFGQLTVGGVWAVPRDHVWAAPSDHVWAVPSDHVWAVPSDHVWAVPRGHVHRDSLTRAHDEVEDRPAVTSLDVTTLGQRPFVIGVAGGSSSGKTTVAERLAQLAGAEHLALIKLDAYYVEFHDTPLAERRAFNYDHPDAFDWPLLNDHLVALSGGAAIPVPVYDYVDFNRTGDVRIVHPAQIVVVEGILVLWEPTLRDRFDLKVFLDTDADIRFIRRLQRDVAERGRTPESVIAQYLDTVRPAHEQFIEPSKRYADVIIPHGGLNRPALDVLLARVRELAV
jgi:uridine kinase